MNVRESGLCLRTTTNTTHFVLLRWMRAAAAYKSGKVLLSLSLSVFSSTLFF
jgi:hypothetical protein